MKSCCILVLIVATSFTACRENQKQTVKELDEREASTAAAVAKQERTEFQNDIEDKLTALRMKLDEARSKVASAGPNANALLVNEISQQISDMDQELTSIRMEFDQLKTGSDDQFHAGRGPLRARLEEFRQRYMRFATGRSD